MEVIEYEHPDSWDAGGMDWDNPDPRRADYFMAIRGALAERAQAIGQTSLATTVMGLSPRKAVSISAAEKIVKAIADYARYFLDDTYDYASDPDAFPKTWTYGDLVMEEGCELYAYPRPGEPLANGSRWLAAMRRVIDRLHVVECQQCSVESLSRIGDGSGTSGAKACSDAVADAMREARFYRRTQTASFSRSCIEVEAYNYCVHEQAAGHGRENWYSSQAIMNAYRVTGVKTRLPDRRFDFLLCAVCSKLEGTMGFSHELQATVFSPGASGFSEGFNMVGIGVDDPSDVDIVVGSPNTIPLNTVIPTSDYDFYDYYNSVIRCTHTGFRARAWGWLDYGREGGFAFRGR